MHIILQLTIYDYNEKIPVDMLAYYSTSHYSTTVYFTALYKNSKLGQNNTLVIILLQIPILIEKVSLESIAGFYLLHLNTHTRKPWVIKK